MDKYIDGRFERLEKALAVLVDSVNKYHPSIAHAREIELADSELSKGLEDVQTHQNNYLRIQELRKSSAALDSQIRDTLSSLASTRKDIVTTHATTFPPGPSYPFSYEELLNYACRISMTTMPSASMIAAAAPAAGATSPDMTQTPLATEFQTGATPSAAPTPSQPQSPAIINGAPTPMQSQVQPSQQTTSTLTTLPENFTEYLNPQSGKPFYPWPQENRIRGGALASNQALSEQGIDPKGYDPVEVENRKQKEEEERRAKEEQEKQEHQRRLEEERERQLRQQEEWRRNTAAGSSPTQSTQPNAPPVKKQFQFSSLDDLDDDDDD
ncbi:unnamed protein product [Clonostachys chloroleuca]|uniref:Mediator of RNA polymerase II transcription subunit 4 n=1 Tax=Clonostachys chloroleuca TaxID=1926264 RepID=A0AA35M5L3_9HYPO|nr:unnamed protein product [Clonostachys chloroleuca]